MTDKKKSIFSGPLEPPKRTVGTNIVSCDNCKSVIKQIPLEIINTNLVIICNKCWIKLQQIKQLK